MSKTLDGVRHLDATFGPVDGEIFAAELERLEQLLLEADWAEARERLGDAVTLDDLCRSASQRRHDALVEMAKRSANAGAGAADETSSAPTSAPAPSAPRSGKPLFTVVIGAKRLEQMLQTGSGQVLHSGAVLPYLDEALIQHLVYGQPTEPIRASRSRTFTGLLRRAIQVRDQRCQDPSVCDVPAHRCEGDHIEPFCCGGETSSENGQCMCATHNRRKGSLVMSTTEVPTLDDVEPPTE